MHKIPFRFSCLALTGALLVGCGSDTSPPAGDGGVKSDGPSPTGIHNFAQINAQILQPTCAAFSPCHSAAGATAANHLDLTGNAYAAIVGVPSFNTIAKNEGKLRVKPCDAANSFLLLKLGTIDAKYGTRMPQANNALPPDQILAISDWIARGAKQSEPDNVTGSTCSMSVVTP